MMRHTTCSISPIMIYICAHQLEEMIRLCDELDLLEAEHFDLTFKLKELKRMKDDLVPRIENELAEAKYV